ncbi:MAG: hypothetical protein M3479_05835 [Actinomycetota bacterium]|nr:hypothetical protein [Actinomycetota bacterium]
MIAKEWWDSWWKLAAIGALAVGFLIWGNLPTPYADIEKVADENANPRIDSVTLDETVQMSPADKRELRNAVEAMDLPTNPVKMAVDELWIVYGAGGGAAGWPPGRRPHLGGSPSTHDIGAAL